MAMTWITTTETSAWKVKRPTRNAKTVGLQDTGARDQVWRGFGGCFNELGWIALQCLKPKQQALVLKELFDPAEGCRFHFCRVPIGANDYSEIWYSHNETEGDFGMEHFSISRDQEHLIPYVRAALAIQPELTLFASPWSPPTWMKFPKAYNYGTLVWTPQMRQAYARYFLKFVKAYRAEGLPLTAVHVQNEPNSDQKFPSCLWTGEKMRDFIREDLGPLFAKEKVDCEIWAGTVEREHYNSWGNTILSDPTCRKFVAGMGFQWAGKGALQRTHLSWPEVPLAQTENECGCGDNSWSHAMHVFDLLWHNITNGVVAYTYWNMVLQPGGLSTWGWKQNALITIDPARGSVHFNHEFYVMKHLSRFVQTGARRMLLQGPWTGNTIGFENPDGTVVLAVQNPHSRAQAFAAQVGKQTVGCELPPNSINTFVLD